MTPTVVQHRLIIVELVEAWEQVLQYNRHVEVLKAELTDLPAEGEDSAEDDH